MTTEAGAVNQAARDARKVREIVVGVDESDASRLALIHAVEEAVCRHASLRVVTEFLPTPGSASLTGMPWRFSSAGSPMPESISTCGEAKAPQERSTSPEVRIVVMVGATGPALVEQSRTAELLVVGHRGRGELASGLLGSVGLYCVLHAHSSVLVVRPPADTSDGTGARAAS